MQRAEAATVAGPDLWDRLTRRGASPPGVDVWQALANRLDLGEWVPVPTPDVEVARLENRAGDPYYVLRSPLPRYLRLDPVDYQLWTRMDGRKTVRAIALEYFQEHGAFVADQAR